MKSFLFKVAIFSVPGILALIALFIFGKDYLAAYRITNSYSFNEKVKFLPRSKEMKILSIGSSMNLNNLYSQGVIEYLGSDEYLNSSVWGLSIMDQETLAPIFEDMYHPKIVICVSNVMDFATPQIEYNANDLSLFLINRDIPFYKWFSFCAYYLKHTVKNFLNFRSNQVYTSLVFDRWGGVPLAAKDFEIRKARWEEPLRFNLINQDAYCSLTKISKFYKAKGIRFIFIQSPVRQGIKIAGYSGGISLHTRKIKKILESDGHIFKDFSNAVYPDSLFVDSAHLNENGAKKLTREIFETVP